MYNLLSNYSTELRRNQIVIAQAEDEILSEVFEFIVVS